MPDTRSRLRKLLNGPEMVIAPFVYDCLQARLAQREGFKAIYMDERTGRWNVWYRASTDGGRTWSADVRLSDTSCGAPYVFRKGFDNPFGDYQAIDVNGAGQAIAAFGEAPSWNGPGGIWVNREV